MEEQRKNEAGAPQPEQRAEKPARRPYVAPSVDSGPLFERMALACSDKDFDINQS